MDLADRYPDLRPFFAEERRKDIEMCYASLGADISRLRDSQMSSWNEFFHYFQSVKRSVDCMMSMWGENRLFLQGDNGELSRHVRDMNITLHDMNDLLLIMCQKEIRGLDLAKDKVNVIRDKAGVEYVSLPADYTEWLSSIQKMCKHTHSGWDDPPQPTLHEVQAAGLANGLHSASLSE